MAHPERRKKLDMLENKRLFRCQKCKQAPTEEMVNNTKEEEWKAEGS